MLNLKTPLSELPGVGPSTAAKLSKLGISTALDLLSHFPIRHEDLRHVTPIARLRSGQTVVLRGRLQLIQSRRGWRRRRMTITEGLLEDGSGSVRLIWFNQPYLATTYRAGEELLVVGKLVTSAYGPQMQSPLVERVSERQLLAGRILPIYRATAGLTQRQIRSLILKVLPLVRSLPDWLPEPIRQAERLLRLPDAIREIHFPTALRKLNAARERLKFGELFLFALSVLQTQRLRERGRAGPIPFHEQAVRSFVRSLPFTLTDDQRRAAWEILRDLERPVPMNRLLEGDVGSGKTIVAAIAMHNVAAHGRQSVLLAPTDILARQHFERLTRFFGRALEIGLLTRTQRDWNRNGQATQRTLLTAIKNQNIDIVVGTHALLSQRVSLPALSLVVIDEQHRFGVEQRHALIAKAGARTPHFLSMTATPIPRTLALALYGDLQLSFLKELPPGRTPVTTAVVPVLEEERVLAHIRERAKAGEQTFVVCPLIEESDELGVAAATTEYERLQTGPLANLRLGLLHGKLPVKEKHRALKEFAAGATNVLVATPVVEVGIDVPNATTIVIAGAERFGLAQLHQLRGRVGRSSKPSTCFLLTDSDDHAIRERLEIVARTTDGFALAEEDLRRRGPGDLYGIRQSGLPQFALASLTDLALMQKTQSLARELLQSDPTLDRQPQLKRKVESFFKTMHQE